MNCYECLICIKIGNECAECAFLDFVLHYLQAK